MSDGNPVIACIRSSERIGQGRVGRDIPEAIVHLLDSDLVAIEALAARGLAGMEAREQAQLSRASTHTHESAFGRGDGSEWIGRSPWIVAGGRRRASCDGSIIRSWCGLVALSEEITRVDAAR